MRFVDIVYIFQLIFFMASQLTVPYLSHEHRNIIARLRSIFPFGNMAFINQNFP